MAVRTTSAAIAKIIEIDSGIDMTPFIEAASALVDEVCATVSAYTATKLELIERWLSAFFYAIRDPQTTSVGAGVSVSFQHANGLHFDVNEWGQMAMMLDTAGGLARLNASSKTGATRRARIRWLGTDLANSSEA